ncbi:alpha-mannosidase [Bombiscardovia nodaiensis]|uniref:Alpha-mannosidase n=1 Tax=Bombiscardovia nodaiensis TaxID=2932181 RepID=A0ABM8B918_9BIFI|nr:alpha-mannosidase [Bombiscardovia nodaiensis]
MLLKVQREVDRCKRVMRERVQPHIHRTLSTCQVSAVAYPGEPVDPASFIQQAEHGEIRFEPLEVGQPWGTSWGTTWMKVTGQLPQAATPGLALELLLKLGWLDWPVGGHIEALVYRPDGTVIKAAHPRNYWVPLVSSAGQPDRAIDAEGGFTLYVEAAYNPNVPSFTVTELGNEPTGKADERYDFESVDVAEYDQAVHEYWVDLDVVSGAVEHMDVKTPRYWKLAKAMQRSINVFDGANRETVAATLPEARKALQGVLAQPADASALKLSAMGHAHIDSAWLWPVRETRRKVGRTVANVLTLLDQDPDFIYVMSSAQQYEWLQNRNPDLFNRVKEYVKEGRFIPVGGMWVESDGMVPSGESLIRQLSFGHRYFQNQFGVETHGVWLPDSFGYSGSWPQIARRSGCTWFLTQKLSWNDTTRLPHHSFLWEGIDGSRIFTHFPPADKYDSEMSSRDLMYAQENFKDKDISDHGILLFGYGDGGGGPTREMTMRAQRVRNLEGLPKVTYATPDKFFETAYTDMRMQAGQEMPVWKGELYLELHRKTLTSQQDMKRGCRQEESWLRTAEYCCALAALANSEYEYPRQELDQIWKTLLLNQFHDILPGSGIAWIYRVAREQYRRDIARLETLVEQAAKAVEVVLPDMPIAHEASIAQFSTVETENGKKGDRAWCLVEQLDNSSDMTQPVNLERQTDGSISLSNGLISAVINTVGGVSSLIDEQSGRELVARCHQLGTYQVLKDEPGVFDAWDVERDALLCATDLNDGHIERAYISQDGWAQVVSEVTYRESDIRTTISLKPGARQLDFRADVKWKVPEKLLKVVFPLALLANQAQYECQYGLVERPITKNTEGDEAQFESCTHRFVRISESGFGVGVVNASTYGSDVSPLYTQTPGHADGTLLRLSLLAAPTAPDPRADIGFHSFEWAVVPGENVQTTLSAACRINAPVVKEFPQVEPLVSFQQIVGTPVIDWIKLADDGSGDVIVRIYEAAGARAQAQLQLSDLIASRQVRETNLLEQDECYEDEPLALSQSGPGQGAQITLQPFQIATLRLS